jgi:hypothetical protein
MANRPSTVQTLKHILKMAACCAGPILGLALLAPLAGTLGIGVSSVLSTLLVLACPLSMLFMMYFMMREQKVGMQGRIEDPMLPHMPPADTAVAMAEGNGQPAGREALPISEGTQPSLVIERTGSTRRLPKS